MGSIDLSVEGVMGAAGMTFVLMSANSRDTTDLGIWSRSSSPSPSARSSGCARA